MLERMISFVRHLDPLIIGLFGLGFLLIAIVIVINAIQVRRARASAVMPDVAPASRAEPILLQRGNEAPEARADAAAIRIDATDTADELSTAKAVDSSRPAPVTDTRYATPPMNVTPEVRPAAAHHVDVAAADISEPAPAADAASRSASDQPPPPPIDQRVHCVVTLQNAAGMRPEHVRLALANACALFPKTSVTGWSSRTHTWHALDREGGAGIIAAESGVGPVTVALPLATRTGAVPEKTLRDWMGLVTSGAESLQASIAYAPIADDAKRAVELDQFCSSIDLVAGLNLMRADRSAMAGTRVRGTLEAEGFSLAPTGAFQMFSEDGQHVVYEAKNSHGQPMTADGLRQDGVHGISLLLDVMRVSNPLVHFDAMRGVAKRLATRLEASVVDDRGHALTDASFAQIRAELEHRVKLARSAGIEPGSALARVLFAE
jgi:hypothetical protein